MRGGVVVAGVGVLSGVGEVVVAGDDSDALPGIRNQERVDR